VLEGLRWVAQGFNNCGPANLSISLNYWGDDTTQEVAAAYLKPNREDRNVSPWQISDYVNEFTNLRATAHARGNLDMLKQLIAAGFPVVIEKGYIPGRGTEGWYGHYLTVYGFNDERQELYSRDTFLGPFDGRPRADSYEEFMEWWRHFYYTFYVVFPPEREQEVMAIIPQQLQSDWTMWQYAAEQARLELEQRPDDVFSLFNLGVALTRLGEYASEETVEDYSPAVNAAYYEEAAALFDRARNTNQLPPRTLYYEHRPLMAYYKVGRHNDVLELTAALLDTIGGRWVEEIHWYRGHALAATGDLLGAQEAYQQALVVNPNFYYAEWSLNDVNSRIGG
jgi:tetratricopeptide (TPR) repeat protein